MISRAKTAFIRSKVRRGGTVRPRGSQPLPTSTPSPGSQTGIQRRPYVFKDFEQPPDAVWADGMGMDAYPLPMIQHAEVTTNLADFPIANLPQGVIINTLTLVKGTAADKIRVDWNFTIPEQDTVFDIDIQVNGIPFINRRFTKPYMTTFPIEFFRKMDTATRIDIRLVQKVGAVLVFPLGAVCSWIIVDGYRASYRG